MKQFPDENAFVEVTKLLGDQWWALTAIQKEKYIKIAAHDKTRYENE